jgi:hypothetical protein
VRRKKKLYVEIRPGCCGVTGGAASAVVGRGGEMDGGGAGFSDILY